MIMTVGDRAVIPHRPVLILCHVQQNRRAPRKRNFSYRPGPPLPSHVTRVDSCSGRGRELPDDTPVCAVAPT